MLCVRLRGLVAVVVLLRAASPMSLARPIALASAEGARLLEGATERAAYDALWPHFRQQRGRTMCGPNTLAMLLDALEVPTSGARWDEDAVLADDRPGAPTRVAGCTLDALAEREPLRLFDGVHEHERDDRVEHNQPGRHRVVAQVRGVHGYGEEHDDEDVCDGGGEDAHDGGGREQREPEDVGEQVGEHLHRDEDWRVARQLRDDVGRQAEKGIEVRH